MPPGGDEHGIRQPDQRMEKPDMELEHAIGYSDLSGGLHYHPDGTHLVYAAGGTVVISDTTDPHKQHILAGHDGMITCVTLGNTGRRANRTAVHATIGGSLRFFVCRQRCQRSA